MGEVRSRTASAGEVVATGVLALYVPVAWFVGVLNVFASDLCGTEDKQYICTVGGQDAVVILPISTAVIGLAIALLGAWACPGRSRAGWLALGYLVAVTGYVVSAQIAATAP